MKRECEDCGKEFDNKNGRICRIEVRKIPWPHIQNYCPICQRYCMNLRGPWTMTKNQIRAETDFKQRRRDILNDK